jgi:hypothetical protein
MHCAKSFLDHSTIIALEGTQHPCLRHTVEAEPRPQVQSVLSGRTTTK